MTDRPRAPLISDVVIVGAGPTGLTIAIELARHGVRCRIIDKAPAPVAESRAIGIVPRTLEVFDAIDMAKPVLHAAHRLRGANVFAGKRRILHLTFEDLDSPYPLVAILPQGDIERLLAAQLGNMDVVVERGVELIGLEQQADAVTARLRDRNGGEEICHARWLVACDGAHSAVRHALGLPFMGTQYEETFALADVRMYNSLPRDESLSFFHYSGQLLIFPLPDDVFRIVAVLTGGSNQMRAEPTLADMQAFIDERGPAGVMLKEALWLSSFRVSRRIVQNFREGRVFLAGDAAHIHSPAGGQGMNTGIQDAHNLAWKLALVIAGHSPEALLDSYHAEREPVAQGVLRTTDRFTRSAAIRSPLVQHLRNALLLLLDRSTRLKHKIVKDMAELTISYSDSPIVEDDSQGQLKAGTRAPDGELRQVKSPDIIQLYEILRDPCHTLLLFFGMKPTPEDGNQLSEVAVLIRNHYPGRIAIRYVATGTHVLTNKLDPEEVLLDIGGAVHQRYGVDSACFYLIRPDGYIGFCGRPARIDRFQHYLDRVFLMPGSLLAQ